MTALTYILGAASLKVLRRKGGRAVFWSMSLVLAVVLAAVKMPILAAAFLSLVILIGVFSEFEDLGLGLNVSAFFALVINSLVGAGAFVFWMTSTGPRWSQIVLSTLETSLKPIVSLNPGVQIKYYDLMLQLPSVVVILWMGALYLAVLLEGRLEQDDQAAQAQGQPMRQQLAELRLPDACVWIFIASLLGAFGHFGNALVEGLSANALNISFMLFFFQGIAVVTRFFEKMRLGMFWQVLFMILIVVHLFMFVSALGLMDYWLDFRARLAKRTEEFNREET